jgi:hypothetical protein
MANWQGGSCPAMAGQIAGGYCSVTVASLRGFLPAELHSLKLELEKQLRNARAEVPPQDDALAQQARNHKIGRLSSALQVVQHQMSGGR